MRIIWSEKPEDNNYEYKEAYIAGFGDVGITWMDNRWVVTYFHNDFDWS